MPSLASIRADFECQDVRDARFDDPNFEYPRCPALLAKPGMGVIWDRLREIYHKHSRTWSTDMKDDWFYDVSRLKGPLEIPDLAKHPIYSLLTWRSFNWVHVVLLKVLYPAQTIANNQFETLVRRKYPSANLDSYDYHPSYENKQSTVPGSSEIADNAGNKSQSQDDPAGKQVGSFPATAIGQPKPCAATYLKSSEDRTSSSTSGEQRTKSKVKVSVKRKRAEPQDEGGQDGNSAKAKKTRQKIPTSTSTGESTASRPIKEEELPDFLENLQQDANQQTQGAANDGDPVPAQADDHSGAPGEQAPPTSRNRLSHTFVSVEQRCVRRHQLRGKEVADAHEYIVEMREQIQELRDEQKRDRARIEKLEQLVQNKESSYMTLRVLGRNTEEVIFDAFITHNKMLEVDLEGE